MRSAILFAALLVVLAVSTIPCRAQTIPAVKAKALDDSEVTLPKAGGQGLLILVVGFSHKSGDNCTPWSKRLAADYSADSHVEYYSVPVLASAPSFVRPMILHGMRKGLTDAQKAHFVPVYDHESEWKQVVNYSAPDDAYIVIAGPDGHVLWETHGTWNDSAYAELKAQVAKSRVEHP